MHSLHQALLSAASLALLIVACGPKSTTPEVAPTDGGESDGGFSAKDAANADAGARPDATPVVEMGCVFPACECAPGCTEVRATVYDQAAGCKRPFTILGCLHLGVVKSDSFCIERVADGLHADVSSSVFKKYRQLREANNLPLEWIECDDYLAPLPVCETAQSNSDWCR